MSFLKDVGRRLGHPSQPSAQVQQATTLVACPLSIAACLAELEKMVGVRAFRPVNDAQRTFLSHYYAVVAPTISSIPELVTVASADAAVLNQFLATNGFDIQLEPLSTDPPEVAAANVFKLRLAWVKPGQRTNVRQGAFDAVRLGASSSVRFHRSSACRNPVAELHAKNGDRVYMTVADPLPPQMLQDRVRLIHGGLRPLFNEYGGVVFPMISYDIKNDISWVKGLELLTDFDPWAVKQALQQVKFAMNEFGAKVEVGTAMSAMRLMACAEPELPDLVFDRPFLLWVMRPGHEHPLFTAYFAEDSWSDPGRQL